MGSMQRGIVAGAFIAMVAGPASADTPPTISEPSTMWECTQADGTQIYTNKEAAGCKAMVLKPLSIVPSLENMPTIPRAVTAAALHYDVHPYQGAGSRSIPDWARDWYASAAPGGSAQEEVCSLFSEWLHLVQKTRGGFWFGSDPSYGGDLYARNQRGPSYSFYDNARYLALSRIFGRGFIPVGCP